MTWKEKSVSYVEKNEKTINSVLGDVKIDWKGIKREEFLNPEEWEKIEQEMEEEQIMRDFIPWEDVEEVIKKDEFLSYPHVDIILKETQDNGVIHNKRKIFFKDNDIENYDDVSECFKAVIKFWYGYRQRNKLNPLHYSYDESDGSRHVTPEESQERTEEEVREEVDVNELGDYDLPTERKMSEKPDILDRVTDKDETTPVKKTDSGQDIGSEEKDRQEEKDDDGGPKTGTQTLDEILRLAEEDPEELMKKYGNRVG